jgi:hypothetical protein
MENAEELRAAGRVARWPLRGAARIALLAVVATAIWLGIAGVVHVAVVAPVVLLGLVAYFAAVRRLAASRDADLADLRAAAPHLTPARRAAAFERLGGIAGDPEPAGEPELEALRRELDDLPGGMRVRPALAARDPDDRPLARMATVRILALYPAGLVTAALAIGSIDGLPRALEAIAGLTMLVGPFVLAFNDPALRDDALGRRLTWALGSVGVVAALLIALQL